MARYPAPREQITAHATFDAGVSVRRQATFPFIVGCGRSGTTLLVSMLDSHPDLAIPGESGFVLDVCSQSASPSSPDLESFCACLESFDRFRRWNLDPDELRRDLEAHRPANGVDAMRLTYASYAAHQGKSRYGDKTPDYVLQIRELAALFPESQFIHLIRDGRDVALANLAASWGPDSIPAAARYWRHRVRAGQRAGATLRPDRYLEVRYEELLDDTPSVLRTVTDFIGLTYDSSMLLHDDAARRQLTMSPDPSADRNLLLPPTQGLRDWRRDMSAGDLVVFEVIAGRLLVELGYTRATSPALSARMRSRVRAAADAMRSLRQRIRS